MKKIILIALLVFVSSCEESPKNYTQLSEEDTLNDFFWLTPSSDSEGMAKFFLARFTKDYLSLVDINSDIGLTELGVLTFPKNNFYKSFDVYHFRGSNVKNIPAKPDFSVSIDKSAYDFINQLSTEDFLTETKSGLTKQLVDCLTEGFSRKSDFGCNTIKFE